MGRTRDRLEYMDGMSPANSGCGKVPILMVRRQVTTVGIKLRLAQMALFLQLELGAIREQMLGGT